MALILNLLGMPLIQINDRVVKFPTRKALALLVYLAVEGGSKSREKITAMFWPESDAQRGRAILRKTLSYLLEALGDESRLILADRASLSLDLSKNVEVDVRILESAAHSTPAAIEQLARAASLYRGDFLEGFSLTDALDFDDWASVWREALHRQANLILNKLSQIQFERGDIVPAIETTSRWLVLDSLDESACLRLMQLYLASANRSAALKTYEAYRAILKRELGAEPALETQKLAKKIRETLETPNREPPSMGLAGTAQSSSPLIGRDAEFGQLVDSYNLARVGHFQVIVIGGEPGIGKTKLAHEFLAWAGSHGAAVMRGSALESANRLPYHPITEALRTYLIDPSNTQKLASDIWMAELSRLLPELRESVPRLSEPFQAAESEVQTRLFEAIVKTLEASAQLEPVVLFLDDLQWADMSSLEFLQYGAHRWSLRPVPLLLIIAMRSEDLATSSILANWLNNLGRDIPLTRIDLGSLGYQDTRLLARTIGLPDERETPSNFDEFCRQLYAEIGGHPFFVIQTLRSLSERSMLRRDQAGEWPLDLIASTPASVRDLIRSRLDHLSSNARMVCTTGAVIGNGFDFEQIRSIVNASEGGVLSAVEELLARGLLQESNRRYYFSHNRIREVAYTNMSETRRLVLHRRVLETIAAPPGELLLHARAIGQEERVFELALAAGVEAMKLFAVRDAFGYFEQAYAAVHAAPDDSKKAQLYLQFGRVCELLNDWGPAHSAYDALLSLAREKHDPAMEAAALNRSAALVMQETFDLVEVLRILNQAQELANRSGDASILMETESNLAQIQMFLWKPQLALAHAHRSLALGAELNKPEVSAHSLNMMAYSHLLQGDWAAAEDYASQASQMYARLNNRALEVDATCTIAYAATLAGRAGDGIRTARRAHAISLEIENQWGQANSSFQLALALLEAGNYQEARDLAQKGVEISSRLNQRPLKILNLLVLGNIYRALFALDEALAAHREASETRNLIATHQYGDILAAEMCADHALAGEWDEAYVFARQALAERDYNTLYVNLTRWHETEAFIRAGQWDLAEEDVRHFGEHASYNLRFRIPYLRSKAVLAARTVANDQAIGYLQEALLLAREMSLPGEEWQILSALGEMYRGLGEKDLSHDVFVQAGQTIERLTDQINDHGLRTLFLTSKQVRHILTETKL